MKLNEAIIHLMDYAYYKGQEPFTKKCYYTKEYYLKNANFVDKCQKLLNILSELIEKDVIEIDEDKNIIKANTDYVAYFKQSDIKELLKWYDEN